MQINTNRQRTPLASLAVFARKRSASTLLLECLAMTILVLVSSRPISAQQKSEETTRSVSKGAPTFETNANLPAEPIGRDDLIGISVYDAPELTRSVRVDADGTIRLPMVQRRIDAAGLKPDDLEKSIRAALIDEQLLVDPIVAVSVIEYRSRPINVIGEVKNPTSFQAAGTVTLFDAISRAGGLTENAGPEIVVSSQKPGEGPNSPVLVRRILVTDLFNSMDPSMNMTLEGGELIRVPEAGHFYVFGNVREPGVFTIRNGSAATVLTALTQSRGLQPYTGKFGYIYRSETGNSSKSEIPVELKKIIDHELPDVQLQANDILYVPEATGKKNTVSAARTVEMLAVGMATTLFYIYH